MQAAGNPPPNPAPEGLDDDECLRRVRLIFPDVSAAYVSNSAKFQRQTYGYCHATWCDYMVNHFLDSGTYPKQDPVEQPHPPDVREMPTRKRDASTALLDDDTADDGHHGSKEDREAAAIERYRTSKSHELRTRAVKRVQYVRGPKTPNPSQFTPRLTNR